MNMMTMVIIMTFIYFLSLILMCTFADKLNKKVMNFAFLFANLLFYFCWNYATYLESSRGGLERPLTFDNISPLMFTVMILLIFMNDRVKSYAHSAISALCFGMFVAMIFSPSQTYLFSFNIEATFWYTSEALCHMCCSLFGIYLAISGQVKPDIKHLLKAIVFMYSLISIGVVSNYIFHTSHFGMDPYGDYSIYMFDIFHSFEATLLAYYSGVFLILCFGMGSMYLLCRFAVHNHDTSTAAKEAESAHDALSESVTLLSTPSEASGDREVSELQSEYDKVIGDLTVKGGSSKAEKEIFSGGENQDTSVTGAEETVATTSKN